MDRKFNKVFVGKGVQHEKLDLVRVTLKLDEALKHKHEFEGATYLTFELARLKEPDKYGRSHTCYVSIPEEVEDEKPKKTISKK